MYLYNLNLSKATDITQAIHGNFSGAKQQEIVIAKGKSLGILRVDTNSGKIHSLFAEEVFGTIRCLMPFRLTGSNKDYIVVGSDAGKIVILEYVPGKNAFVSVQQETFGRSGCRRTVPGQYLAMDPKGRAVMIAATDKQKLGYILNRDAKARLTISSPLEAHRNNTILFDIVGVDVGFENPTFACLEFDYEDADQDHTGEVARKHKQVLTYYELNLSVNHMVRKYSEPIEEPAHMLVTVPGGTDEGFNPSGVLIFSENYVTYKSPGDQPDIRCPIPRRRNDLDDPDRSIIFHCSATHKTKDTFFFLAQTDKGDIFKITLKIVKPKVTEIRLKYFDTVPSATSMCILNTGFLFCASDYGNHHLYQIARLGDNDDEPEFSSAMPLEEGDTFFFVPRSLMNLVLVDEILSLYPILGCQIGNLANEDTPQLYVACGAGPRSTLRMLKHGLEVIELALTELPANPNGVWTLKKRVTDEYDSYIVVSFFNATLVFSIGETIEEFTNSGILGTSPTLSCSQLDDDALVQVYPEGIRNIKSDKRVNDWKAPNKKVIMKCAVNQRQLVIALAGGELIYFELDQTGQLNECTEHKEMNVDVTCMTLGRIPHEKLRSRFLGVGLANGTVNIMSLDPTDCLSVLSVQSLPSIPESICILEIGSSTSREATSREDKNVIGGLYLNVGLQNGTLLRSVLDSVTGDLTDTRTRYLGAKPVKLFKADIQGSESLLAMSSRTWLSYAYQNRLNLDPLSYDTLEYASGFASERCSGGIIAISTNTLRILALEKLGTVFNQTVFPLQYTPRKLVLHPPSRNVILIETEHNAYTEETKIAQKNQMAREMIEAALDDEEQLACEIAQSFLEENLPEDIFGRPKPGVGTWASVIRIVNPSSQKTVFKLSLEQNEAATSLCLSKFAAYPDEDFVIVGVTRNLILKPRSFGSASIHVYHLLGGGERLELVHKTPVDEVPSAICPFMGRILVGVGRFLRLYDLGKKKLLKKCENKHIPNMIVNIQAMGTRIVVSDVQESCHFLTYKGGENQLVIFADDHIPRFVVTTCFVDYNTIAGADKFGNIWLSRIPSSVTDDVDEDPTGNKALWDRGLLSGASQKVCSLANFHVGEIVTSIQKTTIVPGGYELLLYTTISGSIGMLAPVNMAKTKDLLQHLEMHMRTEFNSLIGRDHLSFRSYYSPVIGVVDGDLCELYHSLEPSVQKRIAEELDKSPNEIFKQLEDMRTKYAFWGIIWCWRMND